MRQINLVLLASFSLSRARHTGFSIHDDLVAFPQYEVIFADSPVTEHEALVLVEKASSRESYSPEFSSHADLLDNLKAADQTLEAEDDEHDDIKVSETYEVMALAQPGSPGLSRYLCAIPILKPPVPVNHTASELAKADEARELSRANENGWRLLQELDGGCLYFMSGWWSYSFCYNREVVQFHALPTVNNGGPPVRDPHAAEYVLGRAPPELSSGSGNSRKDAQKQQQQQQQPAAIDGKRAAPPSPPANGELQVKGDQRYLMQRLDGGTLCDLTGRARTVEVQYHCVPGLKGDRIGWIKEVTTCAYLMVVNTPRLCADVAFLPPKEAVANPITCRSIVAPSSQRNTLESAKQAKQKQQAAGWAKELEALKKLQAGAKKGSKDGSRNGRLSDHVGVNIGGVVVGGRNLLAAADDGQGNAVPVLKPPKTYLTPREAGAVVEVVATAKSKAEGGQVDVLSRDQLEKLDLSPELVEEMREELAKIAGDKGWKLEVVEGHGNPREIRGIVDVDPEDEAAGKEGKEEDGDGEGSEEKFFKEEL